MSVVLDETLAALGHRSHRLAQVRDAEVLTVAVVAAKSFRNHHERALQVLLAGRDLSGRLSTARCNRRLHALGGWLGPLLETLGALFARGEAFRLDRLPLPVCRRARARRSRERNGRDCCGSCAAKREKFFGWRRHLVCTTGGVPVAFDLVPGGRHDLTPLHERTSGLPAGAAVYGDKADNAADDEASLLADSDVRLVPIRKANLRPNRWADTLALRAWRTRIETLCSQLEAMGIQRLHARTNPGLELTVHASLLAALVTHAD